MRQSCVQLHCSHAQLQSNSTLQASSERGHFAWPFPGGHFARSFRDGIRGGSPWVRTPFRYIVLSSSISWTPDIWMETGSLITLVTQQQPLKAHTTQYLVNTFNAWLLHNESGMNKNNKIFIQTASISH